MISPKITELKYGNTRCYCMNGRVLVDTDMAGTLPAFFGCAKANGIDLSRLRYLLVTHFHPDHMGIAEDIAELGVKIIAFEEQRDYIHASDKIFLRDRLTSFKPIKESSVTFLPLSESRQLLMSVGIGGEVIHTPGHSDDSISVILDDGTALVGDLPPFRTLPGYDDDTLKDSWNQLLEHGVRIAKFGHFPDELLN